MSGGRAVKEHPIGSVSFSKVNDPKGIRTPVLGEGDRHLSISKPSDPKGIRTPVLKPDVLLSTHRSKLLDRIYGRPNQPIEGMLAVPDLTLTPEQRARAARIAARCDAILEDE